MTHMPGINEDDCQFLSLRDRTALLSALSLCRLPAGLEPAAFMYRWAPAMLDCGYAAKWRPAYPDSVFLAPLCMVRGQVPPYMLATIAPAVLHELVHAGQYSRLGPAAYLLCSLPLLNAALLEPEARRYEKLAERDLGLPSA